jgi:hypothetical protein
MRTEGLIDTVVTDPRYGARIVVTERGQELEQRFERTMQRYGEALDSIADTLGVRGVIDLERLATALWMTTRHGDSTVRARADALVSVKPHISLDAATDAVEEIDRLLAHHNATVA